MRTLRGTWLHYCQRDHGWFGVATDEECTWCGCTEDREPPHRVEAPPTQYQPERSPAFERA
jgi:hypothetical protein